MVVEDVLQKIWKSVFSHRNIIIAVGKVRASFVKNEELHEYNGRDMSDGKTVALLVRE